MLESRRQSSSGIEPETVVPAPGAGLDRAGSPRSRRRGRACSSCRLQPAPGREVEAGAVIGDLEAKGRRRRRAHANRHGRAVAGVLRGVLQRFEAAEVDRRLDVGRIATEPLCLDAGRNRRAEGRRRERVREPAILEERRVDTVREIAKLVQRLLDLVVQAREELLRLLRVASRRARERASAGERVR